MKKYPFVKQEESKDCGAACLSMIIQYYGGYLNMENIRQLININKDGTTAYHIIEGAKEIGFNSFGCQCDLEQIKNEKIIFPLIANVIINKSYTHFVVIYNINYNKKELIIADPSDKIKKVSFESFNLIYNGIILILYPIKKLPLFEKTKVTWYDFKPMILDNKKLLVNIFILSFFVILYSIVLSFYNQVMLDNLLETSNYLFVSLLFFTIISIIKSTSEYFRNIIFVYITKKIELIITMDIFDKLLSLPYSYYRNHNTGDILIRIKDISLIRDTLSKWVLVFVIDIPLMLISFIILYLINSTLTLVSLIIFILYWFIIKIFHQPLEKNINDCNNQNSDLTSIQVEAVNAFETIKGLNIKEKVKSKIEQKEISFLMSLHKYQSISLLENYCKELVQGIGFLVIFFFGCCLVNDEKISLGVLLTFQSLLTYFLSPVRELVDLNADTKSMKNAIIRIKELIVEEKQHGYISNVVSGDIMIKNLNYTHSRDFNILNNINIKIKNGEKIMVIGKSGCGKSTLMRLIKGYYSVKRGCIKIGNKDINDYKNLESILYINQTEFLFTDSLYNNIVLNDIVSNQELEEILKICEIHDIIRNNKLGLFLLVEENGFNLSGGERQRIILARTIIKPFNILIIDEGLSQVDVDMERRIIKKLFKKFYDKTIIVISHRLENLDLFDRYIEINKGKVFKDIVRNE